MARIDLLQLAMRQRDSAILELDESTQSALGQFFTPAATAILIASLPKLPEEGSLRVLDPGAGSGILSAALVERVLSERPKLSLYIVAVERDEKIVKHLRATLNACEEAGRGRVTTEIVEKDYILASTGLEAALGTESFDLVIQNPPYGKLAVSSAHRQAMRGAGIDTPNLYAAFLALAMVALRHGGQLVAITPRSFFNGPYFGNFRRFMLDEMTLDRVHVFGSRSTVFADSGVLQENVVFSGTRGGLQKDVTLSTSHGDADIPVLQKIPYCEVVLPGDRQQFIRLTADSEGVSATQLMGRLPCSLQDLGITVSTGRVVDFRSRDALLTSESQGAFPLVYPGNLRGGEVEWPRKIRKAQWLSPVRKQQHALLMPEGWYTIVKRFSAKEERRRVVASAWSPLKHPGPVAFENHLNVFHIRGEGLDEYLARGLGLWLNTSVVDRYFRTFSGHTQVNATDLRSLRFPTLDTLRDIGRHAHGTQSEIDSLVMDRIAA